MKKILMTLAFVLAFVLSMTMITACAEQSDPAEKPQSSAQPAPTVSVPTPPPSAPAAETAVPAIPAVPESTPAAVPAAEAKEVDQVVGSFKYPPNPYGDDFESFIVFNEDGSFLYATNLFQGGGSYTQTIRTNEDFYWLKTGSNSYELHEDYHDVNGEFVTPLTYDAETDSLYWYGDLYASRDNSFVLK